MSGGHFNYSQYELDNIARELEEIIADNGKEGHYYNYILPDDIIERLKLAIPLIRKVGKIIHHIDYLLSGDYGDEYFIKKFDATCKNILFVDKKQD